MSSYLYAFEGAFYIPESTSILGIIDLAFEFIFAIDMIVCKYIRQYVNLTSIYL